MSWKITIFWNSRIANKHGVGDQCNINLSLPKWPLGVNFMANFGPTKIGIFAQSVPENWPLLQVAICNMLLVLVQWISWEKQAANIDIIISPMKNMREASRNKKLQVFLIRLADTSVCKVGKEFHPSLKLITMEGGFQKREKTLPLSFAGPASIFEEVTMVMMVTSCEWTEDKLWDQNV